MGFRCAFSNFSSNCFAAAREDAVRLRRLVEMEKSRVANAKKDKGNVGSDDDDVDIHRGVNSFKMVRKRFQELPRQRADAFLRSNTMPSPPRCVAMSRFAGTLERESTRRYPRWPSCIAIRCATWVQTRDLPTTSGPVLIFHVQVCRVPEKVQSRAAELSAEIVVASQVVPVTYKSKPPRTEALRQPVNPVNFYDVPDPWLAARTESPAQARKKGGKAAKEVSMADNPYLTSFAATSGAPLRPSPFTNVHARAPLVPVAPAPAATRARQRSPPSGGKERLSVNPYGQGGPTLGTRAAGVAGMAPRRGGSQLAFKTPFLSVAVPAAGTQVRPKRTKIDHTCQWRDPAFHAKDLTRLPQLRSSWRSRATRCRSSLACRKRYLLAFAATDSDHS